MKNHKKLLNIAAFIIFLIFCGLVSWFIGRPMINFVSEPQKFRAWVHSHGIMGDITFVGMMFLQVVVALIPGEPLEIGAGYAFGEIKGTLLCVLATTLGSLAVFALVRTLGIKFVEIFFDRKKINELKILKNSKRRNLLIFLVFFLPGTPKDLITYFVGLTDIKMGYFLLLVSLARLPSIITSTMGGGALGVKEYKTAIIVFAITLIISGIGWIIYRIMLNKKQ
ncbi:MAG: TVP38/TMEM64 family protein [Clostridia bacterium]|nr:TVP38/TMEM64 family protein [Clostridia bacterium]